MAREVAVPAKILHFSGVLETSPRESSPIFDSSFLSKLEQLYLLSKKIFHSQHHAERRSRRLGSSLDFADYRNYALGDDLRSVDWNIYGRLDRLFVKLFEEEQDLPVYFLIDASASMRWKPSVAGKTDGTLSKFEQARRITASLAYIALANLDRVNIHYFATDLGSHMGMARGKGQFHKVLEFLKEVPEPTGVTSLLPSFRAFAQRIKQRGLVFVLSDFFDTSGYEEALSLLHFNQFETNVLQVLDPGELHPELLGDLQLMDSETGTTFEVTANSALLKRYRKEIQGFVEGIGKFCVQRRIGYVQASTSTPFEEMVLHVLREGGLIK